MVSIDSTAIIVALISGLSAAIMAGVSLYKIYRGIPKEDADALQTYQEMLKEATTDIKLQRSDMALMRIENNALKAKVVRIEQELETYKADALSEIRLLNRGISRLLKQLESLDLKPVWEPEDNALD